MAAVTICSDFGAAQNNIWVSLVAQRVKRLPAMQETWVRSLGQEDPLEKEMATHSSTLAWKIPWTEKPGRLQSMGLQRVGHDWATSLSLSLHKIISLTVSILSPSICHEVMGPDAMILVFQMLSFKPSFSFSSFTFIKRLFSSSLSALRVVSSVCLRLLIFLPAILIPACDSSILAFHMIYSAYSLLQWTTFCQNSPQWSICLGWPYTTQLIVSLS